MSNSIRVLLVDDEPALRRALKRWLEASGLTVVGEAENGVEAIAMAEKLRPQVVLMDLRMPKMDGAAATSRIKESLDPPAVIISSAYEDPVLIEECLSAGAYAYLPKGMPPKDLVAAIVESCNADRDSRYPT